MIRKRPKASANPDHRITEGAELQPLRSEREFRRRRAWSVLRIDGCYYLRWSLVGIRIGTVGPLLGEGVELAVSVLLTPVGAGHCGAFGQK
jgi:hypothetical protein